MLSNTKIVYTEALKYMNKDAFFATLIGLGIGLLLTGIILVGPTIVKSIPKISFPTNFKITLPNISWPQKKSVPTPTVAAIVETPHAVTIDSPLPDAIEETASLLVSGSTTKESKIVISGLVDDVVILTNDDGKFAGKVTLTEGKNDILVTSYHSNDTATQKVTVFYTPEDW
jgi:hypothetical protein